MRVLDHSVTRVLLVALCSALVISGDEDRDLYPQIHAILREAETESLNIPSFDDRSVPSEWEAHLYARAGYLEDARRTSLRTSKFSAVLLKGYVVYGAMSSAENVVAQMPNPYGKGRAQLIIADTLWRMGQSARARQYVEQANGIASTLTDKPRQINLLQLVKQEAEYVSSPAPETLSATPHPRRPIQESGRLLIPKFPITAEGFADQTASEREERANANAALLQKLYERLEARDRDGLEQIKKQVTAPFQKTLVLASVEHLLILAHQLAAAEQTALSIPEADGECVLAKAEALNSVAAELVSAERLDRANTLFAEAIRLVRSVSSLPIGKVSVLTSIAAAQANRGLSASSQDTLKLAEEIASGLPPLPPFRPYQKLPKNVHYGPEAYQQIFTVALGAHDLATAQRVAILWEKQDPNSADQIANAWFTAGGPDEALAFVKGIPDNAKRAKLELALAQRMLDRAGAPNF
jgi:hypothetical protein